MEPDILTYYEAEHFVQDLVEIDIREYGGVKWRRQHEYIYKLNIQSHKHARENHEEYIVDQVVTFDKVKVLIYDLILASVWKADLLPLVKPHLTAMTGSRGYILISHEAQVANFLEVLLFHRSAVEAAGDYLIDLIEYCYRKLLPLIGTRPEGHSEGGLDQQVNDMEFALGIVSLSLLRFITDHLQGMPISVIQSLVEQCDIFCVLVPLVEQKPWIKTTQRGKLLFENQEWQSYTDTAKIPKTEAQVWLTIYSLFMNEDVRRKYDLNSYRKGNLLRLRRFLNEVVVDQIPVLGALHRALEEMSLIGDGNGPTMSSFAVQQLPELRLRIRSGRDWKEIAAYQTRELLVETDETRREDMELLMQGFNYIENDPICARCHAPASNRCSKCHSEWYCSRQCQVQDWPTHKQLCKVLAAQTPKAQTPPSKPTPKIEELSSLD